MLLKKEEERAEMPISLMEGLGGRHVEWRFSPPAFLQWGTRYTMELNITVPN